MNSEEHKERHNELHKALDELLADYMRHTGKLLREMTVSGLIDWSCQQTIEPTEAKVH